MEEAGRRLRKYTHAMQMTMSFGNQYGDQIEKAGGMARTQSEFNETYAKMVSLQCIVDSFEME